MKDLWKYKSFRAAINKMIDELAADRMHLIAHGIDPNHEEPINWLYIAQQIEHEQAEFAREKGYNYIYTH